MATDEEDRLVAALHVRVDAGLDSLIKAEAARIGVKEADVVRRALRKGLTEASPAAPPVDLAALEQAIAAGAERVLERLGYLEAEIPGRVEVVLRAGLEAIREDVAQRGAPVPQTPPQPAAPLAPRPLPEPLDPQPLIALLEACTSEVDLRTTFNAFSDRAKRAPALMDAYVRVGLRIRGGR